MGFFRPSSTSQKELQKQIDAKESIITAVAIGGPDSIAIIDWMAEQGYELRHQQGAALTFKRNK